MMVFPKPYHLDDLAGRIRAIDVAASNYPVYEPPHPQSANHASNTYGDDMVGVIRAFKKRSDENFAYFMEQRPVRLEALKAFLQSFGIEADLGDSGLAAVSAWSRGIVLAPAKGLGLRPQRAAKQLSLTFLRACHAQTRPP